MLINKGKPSPNRIFPQKKDDFGDVFADPEKKKRRRGNR